MNAAIKARRLSFQYPGASSPVLAELDFHLRVGEVVGLSGPSGSGKSTLLSILGGATVQSSGSLELEGIESTQWVFQNPHGPAHRRAIDIAAMPALATGATRAAASTLAQASLDKVSLGHRAHADFHTLSGGEAQRLMLARAMVAMPSLLLVDEPTAQLDPHSATTVIEALRGLSDASRIVIIATHDPRVIDTCDVTIRLGNL
ncbi:MULTISPECIES: ABC transporter ATP-binding protein [unclassified Microbacterium]|uniref:ABC transporter ATP-binding protein n=1 Tax=unclassified Microbacterium TaxID=2609290 RepID=UPI0034361767